jgi:hypothetical protein
MKIILVNDLLVFQFIKLYRLKMQGQVSNIYQRWK